MHHYVVVCRVRSRELKIMDPADGKFHSMSHPDFLKEWSSVLILLLPGMSGLPVYKPANLWARFRMLLTPHRSILIQALSGAVVYTILGLSTAIFVQKIVDFVLIDGNRNLLNLMS